VERAGESLAKYIGNIRTKDQKREGVSGGEKREGTGKRTRNDLTDGSQSGKSSTLCLVKKREGGLGEAATRGGGH